MGFWSSYFFGVDSETNHEIKANCFVMENAKLSLPLVKIGLNTFGKTKSLCWDRREDIGHLASYLVLIQGFPDNFANARGL